jgi:hypothetical protein
MSIVSCLRLLELGFDILSYAISNDTTVTQSKGTWSKKTQVHYIYVGYVYNLHLIFNDLFGAR